MPLPCQVRTILNGKAQSLTPFATDGATSELTVYSPSKEPNSDSPLIMMHCALGVQASYYQPFAEDLTKLGYILAVAESRGVGKSSVRPSRKVDWGHYDMISKDIPTHLSRVRELFPTQPLYLLGHSLGGHLQLLYLALQLKKGGTGITQVGWAVL